MQDGNTSMCLTAIVSSKNFRPEFASIYFTSKPVKKAPYGKQRCVDEIMFLSYYCLRLKKACRLENLLKLCYILYLYQALIKMGSNEKRNKKVFCVVIKKLVPLLAHIETKKFS